MKVSYLSIYIPGSTFCFIFR
jgi:transcriptional/translational regulatory protein YebC/TACO1